ncbi:MAG: NAD-dependent epimerase/dehydratase family protein [Minisyncoccia bacterium]
MSHKLILVTGGAGFVGSNLIKRLLADGNRVISLDNYFAGSKEAEIPGAEYREGHTKDIERLVPETPDLIYHLGEYSRVEQSVLEPDIVNDFNTVGTHAVLEYWKKRKCKLVYAGSSTKFGDGGETRKTSPYASTKAANTELVKEYGEKYSLPYAITYFYNVFGEGERSGAYGTAIAIFSEQVKKGQPITVTSPGTQERNFTHVSDIVEGLILVGEKGEGDEFSLGNEKAYSMLHVARLFGADIIMLPTRIGNRMTSGIDTSKSRALGWEPKVSLEDEIHALTKGVSAKKRERRVLVFTTTFHPVAGVAEEALCDLMNAMPDVNFDIVTTKYHPDSEKSVCPVGNATIYRVGRGAPSDKFLLPFLGYRVAKKLHAKHRYLFTWSLMASYGALAALFLKRFAEVPLLVTLADQRLEDVSFFTKRILRSIVRQADQVYASEFSQEKTASHLSDRVRLRSSMGEGDAFANQIRFAYSNFLRERLIRHHD